MLKNNGLVRTFFTICILTSWLGSCNAAELEQSLTTLKNRLEALKTSLHGLAKHLFELKQHLYVNPMQPHRLFGAIAPTTANLTHSAADNQEGIFIYDVKVLSQNENWSNWKTNPAMKQWLEEIGQANAPSQYLKTLFGCGFHSIKNAIYLSRLLTYPLDKFTSEKQAKLIQNFQEPKKFMKHFEFPKAGKTAWGAAWIEKRSPGFIAVPGGKQPVDIIYTPTAQPEDVENLQNEIMHLHTSAPKFAINCMQKMVVLGSQMGRHNPKPQNYTTGTPESDLRWLSQDDVKKLMKIARQFKEQQLILIPIVWSYAHIYGNRHWITIILNKFSGTEELLLADGWRSQPQHNDHLIKLLIAWIKNPENMVNAYVNEPDLIHKIPNLPQFKHEIVSI